MCVSVLKLSPLKEKFFSASELFKEECHSGDCFLSSRPGASSKDAPFLCPGTLGTSTFAGDSIFFALLNATSPPGLDS